MAISPRFVACGLLCVAALAARPLRAQDREESTLSAQIQAQLIVNVLSFDRAFRPRAAGRAVVGVLVQRRFRASLEAAEELVEAFEQLAAPANGEFGWHAVLLEVEREVDLGPRLEASGADVLYLPPVRALDVAALAEQSRARSVRTFTSVPEYVGSGAAVGFDVRDDRPRIRIDLKAARGEGAAYTSRLLAVAEIVP